MNKSLPASGRLFYFCAMRNFKESLRSLIDNALKEDVGDGDHSTLSCIPADARGKAVLKIKQDGVLAGLDVAREIFFYKEPSSTFATFKKDGEKMKNGEQLAIINDRRPMFLYEELEEMGYLHETEALEDGSFKITITKTGD